MRARVPANERKSQETPTGRVMNNFGFKKRLVQNPKTEKPGSGKGEDQTPKISKPINIAQSPKSFPFKPTGKNYFVYVYSCESR